MLINQTSSKLKMFALQETQENKKPCHRLRDNACKSDRLLSRTHKHTHTHDIYLIDRYLMPYKISYIKPKYFISMSHCKSYMCVYNGGHIDGVYCFKLLLLNNKVIPKCRRGKEFACQCGRCKRYRFDPWIRKILWSWEMGKMG